jgi:hypothetical protein
VCVFVWGGGEWKGLWVFGVVVLDCEERGVDVPFC